ncbi:MAG: Fur family transcriptional regulator [Planctomycetota bacterium]|nr:Fur family transcriptional regulator [Planctomycetota bacterium]
MSEEYSLGNVEVSLSPLQRFEEYLQSRGMRMTKPRRSVLEHVFARHEHFDADTLIDQLPSHGQKGYVGRATVYRTLKEFVDAGLLREFQLDGRAVYEHDYGYPQHDHLYCQECQQLIEFQSDELIELREAVARQTNFRVTGHRFIITGVCEKCRMSKRRRRQRVDMI